MTIIEGVRKFIRSYPPLSGGRLNVDFLPEEAQSYSVDVVPCKEIVRYYVDGSTVRQFLFTLASREFYGSNINQNLDNLSFYDAFAAWLEQANKNGVPIDLGRGKSARRIEVTTSGYVFNPEIGKARYQVQCRLEYYQEK